MTAGILGIIFTVVGTVLCAMAQLTGKVAAGRMPPVKMCAIRYGAAAPMCYAVMVGMTGRWDTGMDLSQTGMASLIAIIAWGFGAIFFFTTMRLDSMHRVAPVSNSLSVWTVLLSVLFLREPFFPALAVILVVLVGGISLMTPDATTQNRWKWAIPAGVAVSILWAVSIVLTKVTISDVHVAAFVFVKMVAAAIFHTALSPAAKGTVHRDGIKFVIISAACLVVGDTLLMAGLSRLPASIFAPVFATIIPFGFIGSVFLLGERPLKRNWAGMGLIFLAAAVCGYYGAR